MTTFMSNKHERLSDERVSNWATTTPGRDATMVMRDAIALAQEAQGSRRLLGWWEALGAALAYECAYDDDLADRLRENPTIAGALSALQAERRTQ